MRPVRPAAERSTLPWRELKDGAKQPSVPWRRQFSLLLGLERLLSEEEPKLVDGTVLSAHQVDALSGTLTALLAEAQLAGNGERQRRPAALSRRGGRHRAHAPRHVRRG